MPITKSAKKEQRASKKKKVFNKYLRLFFYKRAFERIYVFLFLFSISIKKIQKEGGESTKEKIVFKIEKKQKKLILNLFFTKK